MDARRGFSVDRGPWQGLTLALCAVIMRVFARRPRHALSRYCPCPRHGWQGRAVECRSKTVSRKTLSVRLQHAADVPSGSQDIILYVDRFPV